MWTAIGYGGFQRFLALPADKGFGAAPIPKARISRLGEVCRWLYGSRKNNTRPVVQSQNPDLRRLDEVLQNSKGVAALRQEMPLEVCLKLSRGDERLLREAMVLAEQTLKEARGYIPTGYTGDNDMLAAARVVRRLAESIADEMEAWPDENGKKKDHRA